MTYLIFWSACCIAYFGFLRASEFMMSLTFDAVPHLIVVDVTSLPVRSVGCSFFTGLFRSGNLTLSNAVASVIWTPTCLRTSPVAAIQYYLAVRGTTPVPPFMWADGSYFTAPQVWVFPANFLPTASAVVPPRRPRQPAFQFLSSTLVNVG